MPLTRAAVAGFTLPSGKQQAMLWDDDLPGFGVRVTAGAKAWVIQYRANGKETRETIGRVGTLNLDEARKLARTKLASVRLGSDPRAEKAEAKARAVVTLAAVTDRYLRHAKERLKPRSYEETARNLTQHWAPLYPLPLHKITRGMVTSRLEEIATERGPIASNRSRAALSALYTYAMTAGVADANPLVGALRVAVEASREHVLTPGELGTIWSACREDDFGYIVKLLILTAQRRNEIGDMTWSEINLEQGLWTISKERTKNSRSHEVPLAPAALDVLKSIPQRQGRSYVFGEGAGGFSGWSKCKTRMDARIAAAGVIVRPWRLHDLRRTAATRMAEMGTLPHVLEAVLNHVSGYKAGVAGVYNRAAYSAEKREALNRWAGSCEHLRKESHTLPT